VLLVSIGSPWNVNSGNPGTGLLIIFIPYYQIIQKYQKACGLFAGNTVMYQQKYTRVMEKIEYLFEEETGK